MLRRKFMASMAVLSSLASLFRQTARAAERVDAASMYGKVVSSDASKGIAEIQLTVMPAKTCFKLEGDVKGLFVGDYIDFHLGDKQVKWKDRELRLVAIEITP
jgi:hypothetical protein